MHQGRLLAQGTADEISQDAKVREAYLGSGGIGHA
jgi:urea transport system ATP-binding protein